jgi:hypothetical protein
VAVVSLGTKIAWPHLTGDFYEANVSGRLLGAGPS